MTVLWSFFKGVGWIIALFLLFGFLVFAVVTLTALFHSVLLALLIVIAVTVFGFGRHNRSRK